VELFKSTNPFIYSNYLFGRQSKEKDIAGVMEHRQILDAILNKDEELLRKNLRLHMENAKKAVCLILKVNQMI
jgi:DNA-binding GntR family transcriptional regulator